MAASCLSAWPNDGRHRQNAVKEATGACFWFYHDVGTRLRGESPFSGNSSLSAKIEAISRLAEEGAGLHSAGLGAEAAHSRLAGLAATAERADPRLARSDDA